MEPLLIDAARRASRYLAQQPDRVSPGPAAVAGLEDLDLALGDSPLPPEQVIETLDRVASPATMRSTGGKYFGFVNGGTLPAALAAAYLTSAWDQNAALPVMSPAAARFDQVATDWIIDLLGLPSSAAATFCGGASVANLTCLTAARDAMLARLGWDARAKGINGSPRLRIVATAEAHVTIDKAARGIGLGTDAIERIPTDEAGRARPDAVPDLDDRCIVVLQAGNVNTGHCDPFAEIVPMAHDAGAWVHVDGAFGLWAAASPTRRRLVEGVGQADSWATDCHKWLNVAYDSGVAIVADENDIRRSMTTDAAYLEATAGRAPMHMGLQMSQRARGFEAWAAMASLGRKGIAELVDRTSDRAAQLAQLLAQAGAEVLTPVVLNQALVAFGDDATTDAVIAAVQADGRCWAGGTIWHARRAMRLSVSSHATTPDDIVDSAQAIIDCWRAVSA